MAPRSAITAGSPRRIGATDRPRSGHRCAPLLRRSAPLKRLHGRRGYVPARAGFHCAAPTVPACALLEHPRAKTLRSLSLPARRCAPYPYASRSPFRSCVAALRARAAARCARLAPGLAPGANPSPRCARLNSLSPGVRRMPRRTRRSSPAGNAAACSRARKVGASGRRAR